MAGPNDLPGAAWYPDPYGVSTLRWWDGARWTDAVHPPVAAPVTNPAAATPQQGVSQGFTEPFVTEPAYSGQSSAVPAFNEDSLEKYDWSRDSREFDTFPGAASDLDTDHGVSSDRIGTNTASSWVIVFMPLLTIIGLLAVMAAIEEVPGFGIAGLPDELLLISIAVAFYLITVLLAVADGRRLYSNGLDFAAHWTWSLLSAPIYLIARSVSVRREVGQLSVGKLIVHFLLLAGGVWAALNFETIVWPFILSLLELL